MMACINNPIRAQLVIKEMFYQFKHELIILSYKNSITFCAYYYISVEIERLEQLKRSNFKANKLFNILPDKSSFKVVDEIHNNNK